MPHFQVSATLRCNDSEYIPVLFEECCRPVNRCPYHESLSLSEAFLQSTQKPLLTPYEYSVHTRQWPVDILPLNLRLTPHKTKS